MPAVDLIMPKMGESIMEATILNWLKKEGDTVELDEAVLEIATDKVDSEVPSPVAGVITKILFNVDDVVEVGKAIAVINTDSDASVDSTPEPAAVSQPAVETAAEPVAQAETMVAEAVATVSAPVLQSSNGNGRFYSPLVLNIARNEGISMSELENMPGSGKNERVTKKDILAYVQNKGSQPQQAATAPAQAAPVKQQAAKAAPAVSVSGGEEIIEMDRMRKLIADHMVMSKKVSPHVTSFVEADVTGLVQWRNKWKNKFVEREGEKLTFTPIFVEAVVKAIKDFPMVNVSVKDENKIVVHKDINIGMATALPSGNLIVPVIKKADQLNMLGLAKQVNDLANRARGNKLGPDDISGGTYTISNVGTFGNVMGTPIINQPQVGILALGAIKKKPVVIETEEGDTIGIRHMMFLSHSYDHRVVDGMLGGSFVRRVADYLEQFDSNREI